MAAAVTSGQLDPLNVAAADTAVIRDILNWETEKETVHELFLARAVADGPIMELPGGELRIAAGFEVTQDRVETRFGTGNIGSLSAKPYAENSRDNTAAFIEANLPVTDSLDLSLSVRHDNYSDFGTTTNGQIGFNFTPTDWLRLYGHWGESFNAPTTLDSLAFATGRSAIQTAGQLQSADVYGEWNGQGTNVVITEGTAPGVEPQTAQSWAIGLDLQPTQGLMFKLNYYEIDFSDIIGGLGVPTEQIRRDFPDKFIWHPSVDEWAQFLTEVQNPEAFNGVIDPADPNATLAYIYDRRVTNFGEAQMTGIDFGVSYYHETAFGTMSYGITGNKQLDFDLTEGGISSDQLLFAPDLRMQGTIRWSRDNMNAKLTVNYTDSFDTNNADNQSSVDEYVVTNLYVGYDFQDGGVADGLSLRFYVDNVFDEDPSEFRSYDVNAVKYSGFTFGRMYKVGLSYSFF